MNISIERLQEIEDERVAAQMDPSFREWFKDLNVSRMCIGREGVDRARHMMEQWQEGKTDSIWKKVISKLNASK